MRSVSAEQELLSKIIERRPILERLLSEVSGTWTYEDLVYRFYHQSAKVFGIQTLTEKIVVELLLLKPTVVPKLDKWFLQIVVDGTGKAFNYDTNSQWPAQTRPLLEAFFHAKYFLEQVVTVGQTMAELPETLPSGWAAVLSLYGLR